MELNNPLFKMTKEYFESYLPNKRKKSPMTVRTYRTAVNQYLDYLKDTNGVFLYQVTFDMITRKSLEDFLLYIEQERNCSVSTRNNRMCSIKAFMKFSASWEMSAAEQWNDIQSMKKATQPTEPVEYMTVKAVNAVINQPDVSTRLGLRDMFIMLFLYQTGARVQELCNVRVCDLHTDDSPYVRFFGKGSKYRDTPLRDKLMKHLGEYLRTFHPGTPKYSMDPLFYTVHKHQKTRMTEDNVRKLVCKYGKEARKNESTIPENLHPHTFRHSIAMHLYQSGVALPLISQWLGHSRLETTLIYAYADTEQKLQAIENAIPEDSTLKNHLNPKRFKIEDDEEVRRLHGLA